MFCRKRAAKQGSETNENTSLSAIGHSVDGGGIHKGTQRRIQEEAALGTSTEENDVPDFLRDFRLSFFFWEDSGRQRWKDWLDMGSGRRETILAEKAPSMEMKSLWNVEYSLRKTN
jgi:hypothetical protein